jgi:hypothetical protein
VLTSTLLSISLVGASAVAHIQCGYKSIPGPFKSVQNSQNGVYQVNSTCTEDFDIGKGLVTKVSGNILTYESDTKPVVPSGMVVMPEKPFRSTTVFDVTLSKN